MGPVKIEIDAKQASILLKAIEVYTRLNSGQLHIALEFLEDKNLSWEEMQILETHFNGIVFPELHGAYYGIRQCHENVQIAFDMKQVIRHQLWKERGSKVDYTVDAYVTPVNEYPLVKVEGDEYHNN